MDAGDAVPWNLKKYVSEPTKPRRVDTLGSTSWRSTMRKMLVALTAAAVMAVPFATVVKAEDTTVIKRDGDSKTVIKKKEANDVKVLPVPHEEHRTTVIKKE